MRLWLDSFWDDLRTSFWFLPTLMVVAAVLLSLFTIHLDRVSGAQNWIATLGWTYTRGPEGSRALLSTVAGSMMTIASVTFSITVVALQLASSQFGPRLLRNFMRDRGNQVALGTFIATFTYCLLVLRTVNGSENEPFVPHIAVTVGLLLALTSLGVLIYFIHHTAEAIQAENVIANVGRELDRQLDRLYPEELGEAALPATASVEKPQIPESFERESRPVFSSRAGYLQAIDTNRLLKLASGCNGLVWIGRRPGRFFVEGAELARVWPADRLDDDLADSIRGAFLIGPRRTRTQDVEFVIDQLVEVGVRALSPGINDPFTAISCIDRLGEALVVLAGRSIPSPYRLDEEGHLRVVTDLSTTTGIVNACFDLLRQAGRASTAVSFRLLETIAEVARHTQNPTFRKALQRQAEAIICGCRETLPDPDDRQEAENRYEEAVQALGAPPAEARTPSPLAVEPETG
jgi:uncharacterized membrane protein